MDVSLPATAGAARVVYTARVTDATVLPDKFWMRVVDRGAIDAHIEAAVALGREPDPIPGVEFTKGMTIAKKAG